MTILNEAQQESLNKHVRNYLHNIKSNTHIVFDLETNGLHAYEHSVLSISASKISINYDKSISILDTYTRYYFPYESYHKEAIDINGLTQEVLVQKRGNSIYPKYFREDIESFKRFCGPCGNFIGHNILGFDLDFIVDDIMVTTTFDTLEANRWIPQEFRKHNGGPRLSNAVKYYDIDCNPDKFHGSEYDVEMTKLIFEKMLRLSNVRMKKLD